MEIRHYVRILRRRAWIPLLLTVAMVSTTALLTFLSKPQYTATATVLVKSQSTAGGSSLSFQQIATSNSVVLRAQGSLHLTEDVGSLLQQVTVTGEQSSNLYRVAVTDANPKRAVAVANAIAQEAAKAYKELAGGSVAVALPQELKDNKAMYLDQYLAAAKALVDFERQHPEVATAAGSSGAIAIDPGVRAQHLRLQLDEKASAGAYGDFQSAVVKSRVDEISNARNIDALVIDEAAAKPNTSGRYRNVLYAAALAVLIGVALAFGIEYLDKSVREPEEVEQMVGAPVIGLIPRGNARALRPSRGSL